jgi:hypothetical protein
MEIAITKNTTELDRLEGIITLNLQSFYEVGSALMEIRDRGFYRDVLGFETFEAYCKDRWDFSRSYAYRLMDSANVIEIVSPIGDIKPTTESQCRALIRLEPQQQREAWQRAVDTAPKGKVTAAHVQKVVREMKKPAPVPNPEPMKPVRVKKGSPMPPELIADSFEAAFDQMVEELKHARAMNWKETSHEVALSRMQELLIIVEQTGR